MKKLEITPHIEALLQAASEGIDSSSVSVYEAIAINTLPVKKRGLFNGATLSESTLGEMVEYVSKGGYVPIHILHDQDFGLAVGKTILAEKFTENGIAEVRILFYVGNTEKTGDVLIVDKLETSAIEEMSIGFVGKHLLCSECGWDYNGPESSFMNYYEGVCANEHIIGEDGVHLNIVGLDSWNETSLVSKGAARGAKIVGRSKAILGEKEYNRLAASGIDPDVKTLYASATTPPENSMDLAKMIELNAATSGKLAVAEHNVAQLTAARDSEKTRADTAEANAVKLKADLEAAQAAAKAPDALKLTAAEDELKKARTALLSRAQHVSVAAGLAKPADDASTDDLIKAIGEAETKLAHLPVGGVALTADNNTGTKTAPVSNRVAASFSTKR